MSFLFLFKTEYSRNSVRRRSVCLVHDLCHNLLQEYKASHEYKALKIHSLITLVYIALTRAYSPTNHKVKRNSHYDSTIRTLEHLVEISYKDEKGPSYYADQLNITLKHLNRICNHVLGTSVSQVITARVLLEAKRLLMFRDLSIAEVANQLGYSDYSYFSRLFKNTPPKRHSSFGKGIFSNHHFKRHDHPTNKPLIN